MLDPRLAELAAATAEAMSFTATAPLMPEGVPPMVRATLAIVMIPLLAPLLIAHGEHHAVFAGACTGAAYGLGASIIAGSVKGAARAVDTMLGSPPFVSMTKTDGPVERLYLLAYAVVLFGSGGFTAMIATLAGAHPVTAHQTLGVARVTMLMIISMRECLELAGPCLFAQALATVITGLMARASPALGGVLFGAQLSGASVVFTLAIGAVSLRHELVDVVRSTVVVARHAMP